MHICYYKLMALTKDDLLKIKSLFDGFKEELKQEFVTKDEFFKAIIPMQDAILAIRKELDTEHAMRYQRLITLEARVQILEDKQS